MFYLEIGFLCDLAPPTVSECDTFVINTKITTIKLTSCCFKCIKGLWRTDMKQEILVNAAFDHHFCLEKNNTLISRLQTCKWTFCMLHALTYVDLRGAAESIQPERLLPWDNLGDTRHLNSAAPTFLSHQSLMCKLVLKSTKRSHTPECYRRC